MNHGFKYKICTPTSTEFHLRAVSGFIKTRRSKLRPTVKERDVNNKELCKAPDQEMVAKLSAKFPSHRLESSLLQALGADHREETNSKLCATLHASGSDTCVKL
ncbi:hypothetical protein BaRGS_00009638 [Batillaria attramentaria]|uniref:Uncharacterized protein n=1 Tax=Batillaria attramentaria TaxID=370345 RepID=A0ABD0LHU9_9CAEN